MNKTNNNDNFSLLIEKCNRELSRLKKVILKKTGITYTQYKILQLFTDQNILTFKEIKVTLDADKGSLSSTINRMIRADLIKTNISPADKRIKEIFITPSGENKRKAADYIINELNNLITNRFTETEYENMMQQMDRIYYFLKNKNYTD